MDKPPPCHEPAQILFVVMIVRYQNQWTSFINKMVCFILLMKVCYYTKQTISKTRKYIWGLASLQRSGYIELMGFFQFIRTPHPFVLFPLIYGIERQSMELTSFVWLFSFLAAEGRQQHSPWAFSIINKMINLGGTKAGIWVLCYIVIWPWIKHWWNHLIKFSHCTNR